MYIVALAVMATGCQKLRPTVRMNLLYSDGPLSIHVGKSVCEQTVGRHLDIDLLKQ